MSKLLLSLMLLVGVCTRAQASDFNLFQVTTDYDPSLRYIMAVDANSEHAVEGIALIGGKAGRVPYPLAELREFTTLYAQGTTPVVEVRIAEMDSSDSGVVEVRLLENGISGSSFTVKFDLKFEPSLGTFEVIDTRSGRPVRYLILHANKIFGRVVGVESLETR